MAEVAEKPFWAVLRVRWREAPPSWVEDAYDFNLWLDEEIEIREFRVKVYFTTPSAFWQPQWLEVANKRALAIVEKAILEEGLGAGEISIEGREYCREIAAESPSKCPFCKVTVPSRSFVSHVRTHVG